MTDEQTAPEPEGYDDLWGFLEEGGFDFPWPIASKAHPYERAGGKIVRDADGRPVGGKVYHVDSPDAETGLRLTALADIARARRAGQEVKPEDVAKLNLDDAQEREFAEQVLGDTYAELIADRVDWTIVQHVVQYAYLYFSMGEEVANMAAREGLFTGGKVRTPANRAERRAASRRERRGL